RLRENSDHGPKRERESGRRDLRPHPPDPNEKYGDERGHKASRKTVAVLEEHEEVRQPSLRIERTIAQRPIREGHACTCGCRVSAGEDEPESSRDHELRIATEPELAGWRIG